MTPSETAREQRAFAARISLLFAAIFTVAGTNLPYLPVWLDWKGLEPQEIAFITGMPLFVRVVVTPVVSFAADRAGDHRRFLVMLSWVGLAALLMLSQSGGFWPILMCTLAFSLAWTSIMPMTETVAVSGVRLSGLDYGRMRLWGSLSFVAATFCGGWVVETWGAPSAIWPVVAGGALTVAAAHALSRPVAASRANGEPRPPRLRATDALALLRSRVFLVFLFVTGAIQAAHGMFYTFGTLHWTSQGLSAGWSGSLWAAGIAAEILLFAFSGAAVRLLGAPQLILIGGAAAVVRWMAMGFDPGLGWLLPLQLLHGLTYGASHLGAMHFMGRIVPERQAGTAQALYASVTGGIAMGGAMLLAGSLYVAYGGRAYWAMAIIAAVGVILSPPLVAAWRRGATAQPQS
jgi:PPP family 3-phenylpropionic acid transporter